MKHNTCPSCGAPYNGRKCKACFYTDMQPASLRFPVWHRQPKTHRKQKSVIRSLIGLLIILLLIALLLPTLRSWGLALEEMEDARRVPETTPQTSQSFSEAEQDLLLGTYFPVFFPE